MSRKNPFASLDMSALAASPPQAAKSSYGMTGAAKTVVRSIEEMAENTKRLMDGETVIELDPSGLDVSPLPDRLSEEDDEYIELRTAIQTQGQQTPILVRPSNEPGRYTVVFGHRRVRAARDLGVGVKAVVKHLDEQASAVAQGQENSARSNLSFIERAFFAQNLLLGGMSKDVAKSALGIDDAMLSKMLSVIEAVPAEIIRALGACKKIGRDKWLSLRQLVLNPALKAVALEHIAQAAFGKLPDLSRFDALHDYLKRYSSKSKAKASAASARKWLSPDQSVAFAMSRNPKKVSIELSRENAAPFGDWLTGRLDVLFNEFRQSREKDNGD